MQQWYGPEPNPDYPLDLVPRWSDMGAQLGGRGSTRSKALPRSRVPTSRYCRTGRSAQSVCGVDERRPLLNPSIQLSRSIRRERPTGQSMADPVGIDPNRLPSSKASAMALRSLSTVAWGPSIPARYADLSGSRPAARTHRQRAGQSRPTNGIAKGWRPSPPAPARQACPCRLCLRSRIWS